MRSSIPLRMGFNHRYSLRLATNLALGIFILFSGGAVLWFSDVFLGWNILPDWIDKYAQWIIALFGIAAGLAVAASMTCSLALLAESAAQQAALEDYRPTRRVGALGAAAVFVFILSMLVFHRIDLYRKENVQREQRRLAQDRLDQETRELASAMPRILARVPDGLKASLAAAEAALSAEDALVQFLSAVQSSTPHRPLVSVLVRASPPYQYCRLRMATRREGLEERRYLERQFYLGFPTALESSSIEQLFSGRPAPLSARLEGEVLDNSRPASWGAVRDDGGVTALLVLKSDYQPGHGLFHPGPATTN